MNAMHTDSKLIEALGGPTKVAELLQYDKRAGGVQRVQNWLTRGIPPGVKLKRPDLFLFGPARDAAIAAGNAELINAKGDPATPSPETAGKGA